MKEETHNPLHSNAGVDTNIACAEKMVDKGKDDEGMSEYSDDSSLTQIGCKCDE